MLKDELMKIKTEIDGMRGQTHPQVREAFYLEAIYKILILLVSHIGEEKIEKIEKSEKAYDDQLSSSRKFYKRS